MASRMLDLKTQRRLLKNARAAGVSPSQYIDVLETAARNVLEGTTASQAESAADNPRAKTGADLMAQIRALHLSGAYGDPNLDSPELARQLREQAQIRERV